LGDEDGGEVFGVLGGEEVGVVGCIAVTGHVERRESFSLISNR
jgi:hypothetical protein